MRKAPAQGHTTPRPEPNLFDGTIRYPAFRRDNPRHCRRLASRVTMVRLTLCLGLLAPYLPVMVVCGPFAGFSLLHSCHGGFPCFCLVSIKSCAIPFPGTLFANVFSVSLDH
jgi:hypothetical protein